MTAALTLLLAQGLLGAFDTLWYHEWRARLPASPAARTELCLHAARAFTYAVVFGGLGWFAWTGLMALVLATILLFEIGITLWDFIEEDETRRLPAGERVMHTIMAIIYGAFLAHLVPEMMGWWQLPTGMTWVDHGIFTWLMSGLAAGVFLSGLRDLLASFAIRIPAQYSPLHPVKQSLLDDLAIRTRTKKPFP